MHPKLKDAIALFNRHAYFDCHEVLEEIWREASEEDKAFYEGLIRLATGLHLRFNRRAPQGAINLLTQGLMMTKTVRKTDKVTSVEREEFFHLYADGRPPLVFRSGALDYRSFGPDLQPSVQANFTHLVERMRQAFPHARYSERLANRQSRARILGPGLTDNHLDVAISLLAWAAAAHAECAWVAWSNTTTILGAATSESWQNWRRLEHEGRVRSLYRPNARSL